MISFDTIRIALSTEKPWNELDRLIRAEQAQGRLVEDIRSELQALVEPIRDTLNPADDADDALMDALDALAGNCHPDFNYKDPPNNTLPTEEEIAKLPRWARVAFAARCARRVFPLFIIHRPTAERERSRTLSVGINRSEQAAVNRGIDPVTLTGLVDRLGTFDTATASPAYYAVLAVVAAQNTNDVDLNRATFDASDWAELDAQNILEVPIAVRLQIRRDFDHLARLAQWQHWTDDTPVPPEVFGPLWPEGPPAGWPVDPDVPQHSDLLVELLSRARLLERMTEDEAVNLFNTINAYYIARTGNRLTMEDLRPLVAAGVLAEV